VTTLRSRALSGAPRSAAALLLAFACSAPDVPRARDAEMPRPVRDPGTGAAVGQGSDGQTRATGGAEEATAEAPAAGAPLVVFLGDSLTAGYGLDAEEAYPAHVERLLAARGLPVRVVNAGVSGDTSAGGRARVDWLLKLHPDLVVVELGGNDALRGQPLAATEENLRAIVERVRSAGSRVLLVGMRIPPSYGPEYASEFAALYPRLAREYDVPLLPFLLEGVAADPELNQPDGIHPNARGQEIVAGTVADALAPLVAALERAS